MKRVRGPGLVHLPAERRAAGYAVRVWVQLVLGLGRMLLRLAIRMAPFLAIGMAGLFRRYRWPVYYRARAFKPGKFRLRAIPLILAASLGGLVLLTILLYVVSMRLAPGG